VKTVRIPAFVATLLSNLGRTLRITFAALIATVFSVAGARAQTPPTFANVTVHDPSVVRDGSTYYVFGSHLRADDTASAYPSPVHPDAGQAALT